jgi:hypothetical protein
LKPSPEVTSAAPIPSISSVSISGASASASGVGGAKERIDPKQAFALLKGYYYDRPFAAVGLEGPANIQELVRAARNEVAEAEGGRDKGGNKDVWPDDAEYAFLAGECGPRSRFLPSIRLLTRRPSSSPPRPHPPPPQPKPF